MRISRLHAGDTFKGSIPIIILLGIITLSFFLGCGKLSNDTDRPTSPVGTSGGVPLPIGPQSSVGTYTLSISADSDTLEADNLNYTYIHANLADTSGRSVENFTMTFSSDSIGNLSPDHLSSTTVLTDANGDASVRFYGEYSGSCTVQASVDLDEDGQQDIAVSTVITLTSSGQPSSAGSYKLVVTANPDTIPADMATYSTIVAKLYDSSGGSVENFEITFTVELGYVENDPEGPSSLATSLTALTDKSGGSSVYFYGARKGSAVIAASVYVNDLVGTLQAKTLVHITEGSGVPGTGVTGVDLSVSPVSTTVDLGTCGEEDSQEASFVFTATVWDETGDRVGSGVRVELSGTGIDTNLNYIGETDSNGEAEFTYNYTISTAGTYNLSATATVIINETTYTDTVSYSVTATCEEAETTLEALASPESIETNETSTITVQVFSANGIAVGQTVNFSTNLGSVSPTSAVTNSSGVATTTFYAGSTAGTATIYITSGTASTTLEITITDAAASITASAPDTTLTLGVTATSVSTTLTATSTVRNASGELIEGVAVGFSITPSSSCGTASASFSPSSGSASTNAAGLAEFSVTVTATATGNCTYTLNVNTGSLSATDTGTITVN